MTGARMFADALRSVPLFGDLDPDLRTEVAERATPSRVEAGEWLFRRGEPAESLYVVLSGRLEVLIESPEPVVIRLADQGAALGELALLTDSTRSASVRARRDSELLGLHRDDFLKLLEGEPAFALALARALAALLRKSRSLAPEPVPLPATIALLPAGPGLAVGRMAELLTTQLGAGTTVLTPPVPQPGPVLDRAERENERVLLVGGEPGAGDEWNRFCIRQADRVLVLAEGRPPADVERLRTLGQREVLLAGAAEPGALAQWLDALDAASGRLVGPPGLWPKTVRRTSRALMGRSVGLVLSGGGARAFAHIGVVEELLGFRGRARPRGRLEHGRVRRRSGGDGTRAGRDLRELRRGVHRPQAAERLHGPRRLTGAWPTGQGDGRAALWRQADRRAAARVLLRELRPGHLRARSPPSRPALRGGWGELQPARRRSPGGARAAAPSGRRRAQQPAHRAARRQPRRACDRVRRDRPVPGRPS